MGLSIQSLGDYRGFDAMRTKICTGCKKEKSVDCFYLYKKRNVYRSNCRGCYNKWSREYGKKREVKDRRNEKGDKWAKKNIESWGQFIPKETNCEVCGVKIYFNSKDINSSIHFDHKNDLCSIKICPGHRLRKNPFNIKNQKIWDSCDFGMLCGRCNRAIPTRNRREWLSKLALYVN